ncbi:hypothetical protein ASD51_31570 [Streptomyces sp. Root55]|uniref:hypothetical protein n=1 Tax=Streptomyces sp. Root55 TaxID=1736554 RepID=UPI0006F1C4D4|nr:hypothetical protein [Streptomyces sp. Root55]KQZ16483.1 hypothetical protein ASD51_31570 [Streptomyces sp. Root55]
MSRIKVAADRTVGFTLMVEPLGVSYELEPEEFMFLEFSSSRIDELEITYWVGGVSVWIYGDVIVIDQGGKEVDRLFA